MSLFSETHVFIPTYKRVLADCLKNYSYIKEGSTISVMGVVMRQENVLMIVPPPEPISIGCQWLRCLLPTYVEGLILTCDDIQDGDVIPV